MKLALFGHSFPAATAPFVKEMFADLRAKGDQVQLYAPLLDFLQQQGVLTEDYPTFENRAQVERPDFFVSLGGDGTLLETATYVQDSGIPVLGINAGRLGFLATTPRDSILKAFEALRANQFGLDKRVLIHLSSQPALFESASFALNEVSILKRDSASMIVVHAWLDGQFLNSYWADGLLVSTPTGSTGYNLSCGGPLVVPWADNLIITPVNPHNLNVRPMIVSGESVLRLKVEDRSKRFLVALDSRNLVMDSSVELEIKKAPFSLELISLEGQQYFNTLRHKLNWGLDARNE